MSAMDQLREAWLNEPYETRNRNDFCRVSGKNVTHNRDEFYSDWSEYVSLWTELGNIEH